MKKLHTACGTTILISDEDYGWASEHNWSEKTRKDARTVYARRFYNVNGKTEQKSMHREIFERMGAGITGKEIDHKDHNGMNNQRNNIRIATSTQNRANTRPQNGASSKFKGVVRQRRKIIPDRWLAVLGANGDNAVLHKIFKYEVEAARAYDAAAKEHFDAEFVWLNEDHFDLDQELKEEKERYIGLCEAKKKIVRTYKKRAAKTHCVRNHEFTAENTRTGTNGNRQCVKCAVLHRSLKYQQGHTVSMDEINKLAEVAKSQHTRGLYEKHPGCWLAGYPKWFLAAVKLSTNEETVALSSTFSCCACNTTGMEKVCAYAVNGGMCYACPLCHKAAILCSAIPFDICNEELLSAVYATYTKSWLKDIRTNCS